jgi:gliding motility-associated-like protein
MAFMHRILRYGLLLCTLLPISVVKAVPGGHDAHDAAQAPSPIRFIQNKGQWESHVRFAADLPLGRVFLEAGKLTYSFCDTRDMHERLLHRAPGSPAEFMVDCHAFTMTFAGANPAAQLIAEDIQPQYHNYFIGDDPSKWAGNVPLSKVVRYKDIYPGIDFVLYAQDLGLKYDFVVQPGADPGRIRMVYEGLDSLEQKSGGLLLKTSVQNLRDGQPIAYQGNLHQPVPCAFDVHGTEVRFSLPEGYNRQQPLVIDPTLVFSTYTGSTADNFGFTATYDDAGSLYAGGIAYGAGYPVTTGAFDLSFNGGAFDVSISKFASNGGHLFSTYIGGAGLEQPHSMIVDQNQDLLIMGRAYSLNYPTIGGAYDQTHNGGADFFVSRLSSSGSTLLNSTFVGGSGDEAVNITSNYQAQSIKQNYGDDARGEIYVDGSGNVYVAGCTRSGDFPTTSGAFDNAIGGSQDGCVFKLSPNLDNLVWSTYLGGGSDDAAYSLKVDPAGAVFVTGGTSSNNFPTTPGTVAPTYQGAIDGFITHINASGSGLLASTYIGTTSYNQCFFLELDIDEDVYVVGQKHGAMAVTPGVWSTPQGGQFIMKLNNSLSSTLWATQFGTSNAQFNISPTAFLVDVCKYIYVSGWGGATNFGGSTTGLPITPGAIQSTTDGSDLYIIVLRENASGLDFSTFMGGSQSNEHVDGGTSRFNKNAEIYQSVCAGCWNNDDFPTTPNAWSNGNNSSGCNLACFKMELPLPGIRADFQPNPQQSGCAPFTANFINQCNGGNQFIWNFDDPGSGAQNTSTLFSPNHTFTQPGFYRVMLVAIDSNSCNIADTSYDFVQVFPSPVIQVSPDTAICVGSSVVLSANGGQNFLWTPPQTLSNVTGPTTTASPTQQTTYQVVAINNGTCRDTGFVTVAILPNPTATVSPDVFICPGDTTDLLAGGGVSYQWSNGGSLSNPTAPDPRAFPSGTTAYVVTVTGTNGCVDSDTVTVNVSILVANAGPDIDLCIGSSVQLSAGGGGTYQWSPANFLSNTSIPNPVANPPVTTAYTLTVTDQYGCQDEDAINITVHPLPTVSAGPDFVMCELDSVPLNAAGAQQYAWTPPTGLSNPNSGTPMAFPTQSITYYLLGTDQFGCQNNDTLSITVLPAPTATATGPSLICEDSTAQVFATGGNSYEWSPANLFNDPFIANPLATLSTTSALVVRVIAGNGCDNTDTVLVNVTPTPTLLISPDRLICRGHSGSLIASGTEHILWSTGDTSRRILVSPDTTTIYTVTGWVDGCPSKPDSVTVTVDQDLPFADFVATPDSGWIPLTSTFINLSTGAVEWDWDFGDGNKASGFSASHVFQDTGRFDVQLIARNGNGCTDTIYKRVIVGADFVVHVPNAFTPNGDGLNDYFNTPWFGVKEYHVMIFDRWGMLIYESTDPDFRWYGVFKGEACQEGVYTYVIEARGYLSEKVKRAGTVTLMR